MKIHISTDDGRPIYLQIIEQVKYLVAAQRLCPGDALPPVRTLAQQLLVNPNTVARAYRELERDGVVYSRRGAGTFVAAGESRLARREQKRLIEARIDALLVEARQLRFGLDEVIAMLQARDAALGNSEPPGDEGS